MADESPVLDWFKGFGWSAAEALPELVGVTPSPETMEWRQENPIGGFTSEFIGGAVVPYAGWFKAAKLIKPIERAATAAAGLSKSPFLSGAAQTAVQLAPFEAGRILGNELVGDQTLMGMVGAAGTDLALGSGVGGLLHGIAAGGKRTPRLKSIFPDLDVNLPAPILARKMKELIESGAIKDADKIGPARKAYEDMRDYARSETLPETQRYVTTLEDDPENTLGNQLNRLFKGTTQEEAQKYKQTTWSRMFSAGEGHFDNPEAWGLEAKEAGLPDGFDLHGQYFRSIRFNPLNQTKGTDAGFAAAKKHATNINDMLTKNMESVGDGMFLTREADDGMFVMAKKYAGKANKGNADDKWLIFKTDNPGYFASGAQDYADAQVAAAKWNPQLLMADDAGPIYNSGVEYEKNYSLHDYAATRKVGQSKIPDLLKAMTPQGVTDAASGEAIARVKEFGQEYLTPRLFQLKNSDRGNYIINRAKFISDTTDRVFNALVDGTRKLAAGANLLVRKFEGKPSGYDGLVPLRQAFNNAGPEAVQEWHEKVWKTGMLPARVMEEMTAGRLSPKAANLARDLTAHDDWMSSYTNKVELATGNKPTEFDPAAYGMPRRWEGDTRFKVVDNSGKEVASVGGANRRQAQSNLEKLLKENPGWRLTGEVNFSQEPPGIAKYLGGKGKLLEDQSMRGYKWDLEKPTADDVFKEYEAATRRRLNYQQNLTLSDQLATDLTKLQREDLGAYRIVTARLDDYMGRKSWFSKAQNEFTDKYLANIIGTDSAAKIAQFTNTALTHLSLGSMKIAFPAINMLQVVQTVAPEYAFVLGATPERMAPYYSHFAAGGQRGPIGGMAVLNPIKMFGQTLKDMFSPSADLRSAINQAVNDRVLDAKVGEEFIGKDATRIRDLKKAFSSAGGFVDWIRASSEFMMSHSERLARTNAFVTGYNTAKGILRNKAGEPLTPDQMYQFAREFTEKTMYAYGTADRPRMFTTPAGSMLGLFKNWQFHYGHSMLQYIGEAKHGNIAPLLWQTGATMGIGGLAATPLVGVADQFSKMWSDKSTLQHLYNSMDENADWVVYGLPAMLGVSLSSAVNIPALSNPTRDASSLFSIAAWGRLKSLATATQAGFDHWQATGEHPGYNREFREDMIKSFMPTTVYRSISAFANPEAITSAGSGYPLMKDPSMTNKLLYAAGFNPLELERGYEVSKQLWETHDTLKKGEHKLGKAWAEAEMSGNSNQMALIMRQSMVWGVDVSRVIKYGMYEINKHRKDIIERQLKPRDIGQWRKVIAGGIEGE